ncbi:MAG: signal recognition particle-docking protein FtsY [Nitrospirota bacterium]|nr:signal recognition particle-docking protein FtsY [Nitrospirota bacterium]
MFSKIREGLTKSRNFLADKLGAVLAIGRKVDEELMEELEELLIGADFGMSTTMLLMEKLRYRCKRENVQDAEVVKKILREEISALLRPGEHRLTIAPTAPTVYLFLGVNGVGKTTTIGKLAKRYKDSGKNVLLAAGDTFRAAAIEQLETWGERAGVQVIRHQHGADPSAVVFDAITAAKARGVDILLIDTAGRLHNKEHLMEELRKIRRVAGRELEGCPHETLLVLDAVTGQNGLAQAKTFHEVAGLTGIVLTKLDGSAKGGIVVAIANDLKLPIKLVGVGEKVEDLLDFDPAEFAQGLFD